MEHARRARRLFSSDVPHRLDQPAPPYEPYYVPHGPHGVRRVVLAGREARADPGGARPHVLGGRVVCRKAVDLVPFMCAPRTCMHGRCDVCWKGRCLVPFLLENLVF